MCVHVRACGHLSVHSADYWRCDPAPVYGENYAMTLACYACLVCKYAMIPLTGGAEALVSEAGEAVVAQGAEVAIDAAADQLMDAFLQGAEDALEEAMTPAWEDQDYAFFDEKDAQSVCKKLCKAAPSALAAAALTSKRLYTHPKLVPLFKNYWVVHDTNGMTAIFDCLCVWNHKRYYKRSLNRMFDEEYLMHL